jgi:hypothetical protein
VTPTRTPGGRLAPLVPLLLLAVGAALLAVSSRELSYVSDTGAPGPGFLPRWVGGALMVVALVDLVGTTRRAGGRPAAPAAAPASHAGPGPRPEPDPEPTAGPEPTVGPATDPTAEDAASGPAGPTAEAAADPARDPAGAAEADAPPDRLRDLLPARVVLLLVIIGATIALMPYAGAPVALAGLVFAIMRWVQAERVLRSLVTGVATAGAIYAVFELALGMPMPHGIFGP